MEGMQLLIDYSFIRGKEFNCLLKSSKTPNLVPVDFASHAKSMGAKW